MLKQDCDRVVYCTTACFFPRTIACRSNDPFMSLYKQRLGTSECGRQAWPNVRFHRASGIHRRRDPRKTLDLSTKLPTGKPGDPGKSNDIDITEAATMSVASPHRDHLSTKLHAKPRNSSGICDFCNREVPFFQKKAVFLPNFHFPGRFTLNIFSTSDSPGS